MNRNGVAILLLAAFHLAPASAQDKGSFLLSVSPGAMVPLFESTARHTIGASAGLHGEYILPSGWLYGSCSVEYSLLPLITDDSLNTVAFTAGGGVQLSPVPWLAGRLYGAAGYLLGFIDGTTGGAPLVEAGTEFRVRLSPAFWLGAGASYRHCFYASEALYQGLGVSLGAVLNLSAGKKRSNLELRLKEILPVFPVFYKYYHDHPLGSVLVRNGEKGTIRNVKVSFLAEQYMSSPKVCAVIEELRRGEEREIPLHALFTERVLEISESTMTQANVLVEYEFLDQPLTARLDETLLLNHRNAMTWDDDRKAASFVTANDPTVLRFAKAVAGLVRAEPGSSVSINFRQALGIFEALSLAGLNYVADPNTPYVELSRSDQSIDYLQFPHQTLEYKAGDCDDLSILYCALLEAAGIETAFITVPGHIFAAFAVEQKPDEARALFLRPEDLIFREGKAWVPVEITMIREGFLDAWQTGAREWREGEQAGTAAFHPIHQAWKLYEPVAILGSQATVAVPEPGQVLKKYAAALSRFVEREIEPRVSKLRSEIATSNNDPRQINRLGVLYALYGLLDKAEAEFKRIPAAGKNFPALVNLGNLYFLKKDCFLPALISEIHSNTPA
jgi:hypothetical protein